MGCQAAAGHQPLRVREQIGVAVGDILEAKVERGTITLTPKPVVDRAIAEGLEDVRKGRVRGPFKTVDETIDSLKGRKRRTSSRTIATTAAHHSFRQPIGRSMYRNSE